MNTKYIPALRLVARAAKYAGDRYACNVISKIIIETQRRHRIQEEYHWNNTR